jgi:hypothetical protein
MRSDRDTAEREELRRDVQRRTTAPRGAAFIQIDRPEVVVAVLSVAAPALTQWSEIFWPAFLKCRPFRDVP